MEIRNNLEEYLNERIEEIRGMEEGEDKNEAIKSYANLYNSYCGETKILFDAQNQTDRLEMEEKFKREEVKNRKREIEYKRKNDRNRTAGEIAGTVMKCGTVFALTGLAWKVETKGMIPNKFLNTASKIRF